MTNKIFKILTVVIALLFVLNAVYFWVRSTTETFPLLNTLASSAELEVSSLYFYFFFFSNLILFGSALGILLRNYFLVEDDSTSTPQITETEKVINQTEKEEQQRQQKETKLKEEFEKNKQIERILVGLDQQATYKLYCEKFLSNLSKEFEIVQGLFYMREGQSKHYKMVANYAFYSEREPREFEFGEGLTGQVAKNKKLIYIDNIPDDYITVLSGLGSSSPKFLVIFPILYRDESVAIVEIASFNPIDEKGRDVLDGITNMVGPQLMSKV